jgi:hypothetical protein
MGLLFIYYREDDGVASTKVAPMCGSWMWEGNYFKLNPFTCHCHPIFRRESEPLLIFI